MALLEVENSTKSHSHGGVENLFQPCEGAVGPKKVFEFILACLRIRRATSKKLRGSQPPTRPCEDIASRSYIAKRADLWANRQSV